MPPREFKPKGGGGGANGENGDGGEGADENAAGSGSGGDGDGVRTAAEVLQEATRVTPSIAGKKRQMRMAEAPPGVESLQTENQRRRALPLSKLKRAKPKKRYIQHYD